MKTIILSITLLLIMSLQGGLLYAQEEEEPALPIGEVMELIKKLDADAWEKREEAYFTLYQVLPDPKILDLFITKGLVDKHPNVRQTALKGIASVGTPELQDPIIKMLEDESWFVRKETAELLIGYPNKQSMDALSALQNDPHPYVKRAVEEAMATIHGIMTAPEPLFAFNLGLNPINWNTIQKVFWFGYAAKLSTTPNALMEFSAMFMHQFLLNVDGNLSEVFQYENMQSNTLMGTVKLDFNNIKGSKFTPFFIGMMQHDKMQMLKLYLEVGPGIKYDIYEEGVIDALDISLAPIYSYEHRTSSNQKVITNNMRASLRFRLIFEFIENNKFGFIVFYKPSLFDNEIKAPNFYNYKVEASAFVSRMMSKIINFNLRFVYDLDTSRLNTDYDRDQFRIEGFMNLNFTIDR